MVSLERFVQGELDLGVVKREVRRRGRRDPDFPVTRSDSEIARILQFVENQEHFSWRGDIGDLMSDKDDRSEEHPRRRR